MGEVKYICFQYGKSLILKAVLNSPYFNDGSIMNYVTLWLTAYINPIRFADELRKKPAPQWGFVAALQRGLMDSLLTYLPVYLLGRTPPTPSNLSFIQTGPL